MSKHIINTIILLCAVICIVPGCKESYTEYSDAEYVMFADSIRTYPVQKDVEYIRIPVVSTVKCSYDRTFGVEIIDKESNAIETLHYRLASNTITIPAGENRADVLVHGYYDNIGATDSLGFTLSLVMPDQLEMPMYGRKTSVVLMKSCPFDINGFTGWCVLSSTFLQAYNPYGSYQRLIRTSLHPTKENTIICHNWILNGYDVTLTFHPEDPMSPLVTMDEGQIMSDEGSFFGQTHGDDRILVRSSRLADSYFYPCGNYLYIWTEMYLKNLGETVGTVGHFYNVMEWISDEEAERLQREEGM